MRAVEHENRRVLVDALLANRPADGDAVDMGQHQVEHDGVERLLEQALQPLPAVADRSTVVAGPAQLVRHQLANAALVLDHEHTAGAAAGRSVGTTSNRMDSAPKPPKPPVNIIVS